MSKQLSAAEYREALALVLAELDRLDPREPLDTAERLGRLKAHIATVIGTRRPRIDPVYGLHVLRRNREEAPADGAEPDRAAEFERAKRGEVE